MIIPFRRLSNSKSRITRKALKAMLCLGRADILHGERVKLRRAADARLQAKIGCHTFRATGITAYLEAGGTLENAQAMAAHESPRTTKLYDRTADVITLDEVERIVI
jgi:integrase